MDISTYNLYRIKKAEDVVYTAYPVARESRLVPSTDYGIRNMVRKMIQDAGYRPVPLHDAYTVARGLAGSSYGRRARNKKGMTYHTYATDLGKRMTNLMHRMNFGGAYIPWFHRIFMTPITSGDPLFMLHEQGHAVDFRNPFKRVLNTLTYPFTHHATERRADNYAHKFIDTIQNQKARSDLHYLYDAQARGNKMISKVTGAFSLPLFRPFSKYFVNRDKYDRAVEISKRMAKRNLGAQAAKILRDLKIR